MFSCFSTHFVSEWCSTYFEKTPCVDFNPVFADYKSHFDKLVLKYNHESEPSSSASSSTEKVSDFKQPAGNFFNFNNLDLDSLVFPLAVSSRRPFGWCLF